MTQAGIDESSIGQLAVTAGSLLLNEPGAAVLESLQAAGHTVSGERVRQLFYDRLGIPQSGLYLPPYEHVFRKRERKGGIWHFPAARHDGATRVESIYSALGFQWSKVPANALFNAANIPGDHLGYMLIFAGTGLQGIASSESENPELAASISLFIRENLDDWVDDFCTSLPMDDTGGYLEALADAVQEAVGLLRAWRAEADESTIPIQDNNTRIRVVEVS